MLIYDQEEKIETNFSLQRDEHSAVVFIDKEPLKNFREDLEKYSKTSDLKSYINPIERISTVRIEKINPELTEWVSKDTSDNIEFEMFPNLGSEHYISIFSKLIAFLEKVKIETKCNY